MNIFSIWNVQAQKISFLAFKLNLFSYDFGGATMFWGRLCFSTLVFLLRLYLGGDYVSGATTFWIITVIGILLMFVITPLTTKLEKSRYYPTYSTLPTFFRHFHCHNNLRKGQKTNVSTYLLIHTWFLDILRYLKVLIHKYEFTRFEPIQKFCNLHFD